MHLAGVVVAGVRRAHGRDSRGAVVQHVDGPAEAVSHKTGHIGKSRLLDPRTPGRIDCGVYRNALEDEGGARVLAP